MVLIKLSILCPFKAFQTGVNYEIEREYFAKQESFCKKSNLPLRKYVNL